MLQIITRVIAFWLGVLTLLNLGSSVSGPGYDANLWWIDLRPVPTIVAHLWLAAAGVLLLAFAGRPILGGIRRVATTIALAGLAIAAAGNALTFTSLRAAGVLERSFPLPFSLAVLAAVLMMMRQVGLATGPGRSPQRSPGLLRAAACVLFTSAALLLAFPLGQMVCFGRTDYRRPADAVVVLGARVYADGRLSDALAQRVDTACDLYDRGLVSLLVFSGGPGDGAVDEPQAMRAHALRRGVPDHAITLDHRGYDTAATVANTTPLFRELGLTRVMAVSHAFHLPRVKLTYQRAGCDVYTVPARGDVLRQTPYLMAREVAALWVYYVRTLTHPPLPHRRAAAA